ncbi:MAG: hypothetical protein A2Z20_01960 [Bdellovibrionales bacterium RBG_16_40_8]|nr:MAG: hypothetical protein A2Z20_01960 [Bdellovibrionales bacterium RBG_16_40_8]
MFTITEDLVGLRIDKALSTHPKIDSRSHATSLIDRGLVTLAERNIKPAHRTSLGEEFVVYSADAISSQLVPYDFKLDVVYEDDHLIVVNKPSGLVVHPAVGHHQDTLVNALLYHTKNLASDADPARPGIVHRIDKDTSGLLVVAKQDSALRALARQFKKKEVHRIYWAVTYGKFNSLSGTITSYMRRHPTDRKKFASEKINSGAIPKGKLAITHYKTIKIHPSGLSLVNCQLETGRTHQIRVHLSEHGNPIVGDPFYCTSHRIKKVTSNSTRKVIESVPHLMLHAAELGFNHPTTGKLLIFRAPWPQELSCILEELGFS